MKKKYRKAIEINENSLRQTPLPDWPDSASKADYGKLLIIGGSRRLPGAAILSARAALRCGVGTVRLAAPQSIATQIGIAVPELMVIPLAETERGTVSMEALDTVRAQFGPCDAVVFGPGLDSDEETDEFIRALAPEIPLPTLLDASAILALAGKQSGAQKFARVWTPHGGELETLADIKLDEVDDEEAFALEWAQKNASTLVWKGRDTLIVSPTGEIWRNTAGTRGMGTAGSGDVLTGAIGALLAQGMEPPHAAVWGVHTHARAGELGAKEQGDDGMMASDFLERLPHAVKMLRKEIA
ncbi:MAG TPA: NAD(P)H-hydrate dehydratase [Abditibacteriaceae bacterium]